MKKLFIAVAIYCATVVMLFSCGVIWTSPPFYKVKKRVQLEEPIMDMEAYGKMGAHRRPYVYSLKSESGGKVYILGLDHTKDPHNPQLDTLRQVWDQASPTLALVEGRLGFLFTWFQDPVKSYGENGLTAKLAKEKGIDLYTWEPTKEDQIEILMQIYSPEQLAMLYAFRPYFSKMRYGKPENPEKKLQEYLESRTDIDHLRGVFSSWTELDSLWRRDFPEIEWRDYSDQYGWPEGYLSEMANRSNLLRDEHMVQIILEAVKKGEIVFVTMGSSHAPRIEKALQRSIK